MPELVPDLHLDWQLGVLCLCIAGVLLALLPDPVERRKDDPTHDTTHTRRNR